MLRAFLAGFTSLDAEVASFVGAMTTNFGKQVQIRAATGSPRDGFDSLLPENFESSAESAAQANNVSLFFAQQLLFGTVPLTLIPPSLAAETGLEI